MWPINNPGVLVLERGFLRKTAPTGTRVGHGHYAKGIAVTRAALTLHRRLACSQVGGKFEKLSAAALNDGYPRGASLALIEAPPVADQQMHFKARLDTNGKASS